MDIMQINKFESCGPLTIIFIQLSVTGEGEVGEWDLLDLLAVVVLKTRQFKNKLYNQ